MSAPSELLHRGSKVFWKVRCTVDVYIIKHAVFDVLEVVCWDPILCNGDARLYLRYSILLQYLEEETLKIKKTDMLMEDNAEKPKQSIYEFIIERIQIKTYIPRNRVFQIEMQPALFSEGGSGESVPNLECPVPANLVPFDILKGRTLTKEPVHVELSSGRSLTPNSSKRPESTEVIEAMVPCLVIPALKTENVGKSVSFAQETGSHSGNAVESSSNSNNKKVDMAHITTSSRTHKPFVTPLATGHNGSGGHGHSNGSRTNSPTHSPAHSATHSPRKNSISPTPSAQNSPRLTHSPRNTSTSSTSTHATPVHRTRRGSLHNNNSNSTPHNPQSATTRASFANHHAVGSHHTTHTVNIDPTHITTHPTNPPSYVLTAHTVNNPSPHNGGSKQLHKRHATNDTFSTRFGRRVSDFGALLHRLFGSNSSAKVAVGAS